MEKIIADPVEGRVVDNLFTLIERHVGYVWNHRSNISELTQQIEKLRDGRFRVQQSVDEANRQGDEIFPDVEKWLSRAEEMIKETDKFLEDEREAANRRMRGCFQLKLRYKHSKKAKRQTADIVIKIQEAGNFGVVAHRPPPPGIGFSSISTSEAFESREAILNHIMEALRDDGIRMIGVWGMGGVGKTTLVQKLAQRAQAAKQANEENLFDTVVMALNISQTPDVIKIQGDIASILGLKLEETNEKERAGRLSQSLKKHKKTLVILDDIWEPIAFEAIGIPYGADEHPMGYCKVLLSSREHDLLSKDMGTHIEFHVQHLCEEEAWSLFKQIVGDSAEDLELHPIATEVVNKCEGLPVAIVTIAKALKGESEVGIWRNALEELRRYAPTNIRGVSKNVYACLELSYNYLESDDAKSLFLLCGLVGNGGLRGNGTIALDDLLKYAMGLDLFGYMNSLEKARDKVVTLVKILKASSLLLDVVVAKDAQIFREPPSLYFLEEGGGYVRMHDVIRDVAKSIASKDPHRFVVIDDVGLQEWEKRGGELRNCTGMSLKCICTFGLPEGLACPKLRFLSLDCSYDNYFPIPDTFFEKMKRVRVLSLSRVDLSQPPSSLHFLSNLRALCLDGHWSINLSFKDTAVLGGLKKLQILSIVGYRIVELSNEMIELAYLRMLSLIDCTLVIPRNVISSLSSLEHLCLRNISYDCESEVGVEGGERNTWVPELKHLANTLRALEVEIPHSYLLPKDASFDNLTRYDILIGYQRYYSNDNRKNTSRRLMLEEVKGPHLVKWFSKPLKIVEILDLSRFTDIKHFVNELDSGGFLHLKHMSISSNDEMEYIMNTMDMDMERVDPPPTAFPLLKELNLDFLFNLEAVCHGPIPVGCFANLKILRIESCYSLRSILETPTTPGRESVIVFPQLQHLELDYLPLLISFYSKRLGGNEGQLIIPFFDQQVAVPRLEFLSLKSIDNIRKIWHNQHLMGSWCKLEKLVIRDCKILQTVFPSTFLDRLQNLNALHVNKCPSVKYLFPTSVVNGLVQLEVLEISDCGVEEIVAANENGLLEAEAPIFLFPKLTSLNLSDLYRLKRFYQGMHTLCCPLLKKLVVCNCDNVVRHFQDKRLQGEVDKQPLFLVDKDTFANMEELELSLKDPAVIWRGQYSRKLLRKLRVLEIKENHDASVAIPSSELHVLHNLKQISLRSCNSVEKVIQVHGETLSLPQLTTMYLEDLLMFKHLSGFGLEPILQNIHYLHVSKCGNLINLVSPSMAKRLVQLKKLSITDCSTVKEIVGDDDAATNDICFSTKLEKLPQLEHFVNLKSLSSASNILEFPSLEEMELKELPELTHLYKKIHGLALQNLQKLRILEISDCGNLDFVLTFSMAKTLVQLGKLVVKKCDKMKEIVESGGGESTDDEIIFTKLKSLELQNLSNLKSFCSARCTFTFPCLEYMRVRECPEMEYFCKGGSTTGGCMAAEGDYSISYWEKDLNVIIQKIFMKTHAKEENSQETVADDQGAEKVNFGGSGSLR